MNKSLQFITKTWLESLNYDLKDFEIWFSSHPDFPLLKSITDTLDFFNIESITAEVDEQTLLSFDKPFLALIYLNGNQQIAMVELSENKEKIKITSNKNAIEILSINDFFKIWQRIVVVVDENRKKGLDININITKYIKKALLLLIVIGFSVYIYITKEPSLLTLGFLISLFGLFISTLLLKKDYNIKSNLTDKFCTALPNSSCESVINSKGSKFWGISLSEISFVYFSGIIFYQLISPDSFFLPLLSIITIPMIIFSLYYQWRVVKTWCPLCLMIVLCLGLWVTISCIFILPQSNRVNIINESVLLLLLSFGLTTFLLFYLKPSLKELGIFNDVKKELISFKRDYHLFMPFYVNMARKVTKLSVENEIILGNKIEPLITLTAITNPLCESCIETHKVYKNILEKYPQIQLRLRFLVPFNDRKDPRTFISEQMLNINQNQPDKIEECLSNWYKVPDVKVWIDKWNINNDFVHNQTLMSYNQWCLYNEMDYTPALAINDKVFPRIYDPRDIQYFIAYIIEYEQHIKQKDNQLQRL